MMVLVVTSKMKTEEQIKSKILELTQIKEKKWSNRIEIKKLDAQLEILEWMLS